MRRSRRSASNCASPLAAIGVEPVGDPGERVGDASEGLHELAVAIDGFGAGSRGAQRGRIAAVRVVRAGPRRSGIVIGRGVTAVPRLAQNERTRPAPRGLIAGVARTTVQEHLVRVDVHDRESTAAGIVSCGWSSNFTKRCGIVGKRMHRVKLAERCEREEPLEVHSTGERSWPARFGPARMSFGLVNIPVRVFSAIREHDVRFHQLAPDGSRIHYKRVSEKTGREVEFADIKKGYETSKGKYVVFDRDELKRPRAGQDEDDRHRRLRGARRHRSHLLRSHVPPGARGRAAARGVRAAGRRDGRAPAHRHRQGRDAREAVPRRDPPVRQGPGDVDDALRRRGRSPSRTSTASRREADGRPRARSRWPLQILDSMDGNGTRSATTTTTRSSCARVIKAKAKGKTIEAPEPRGDRRRCSTSWRRCGPASRGSRAARSRRPGPPATKSTKRGRAPWTRPRDHEEADRDAAQRLSAPGLHRRPHFDKGDDMAALSGSKVAFLVANQGIEQVELTEPGRRSSRPAGSRCWWRPKRARPRRTTTSTRATSSASTLTVSDARGRRLRRARAARRCRQPRSAVYEAGRCGRSSPKAISSTPVVHRSRGDLSRPVDARRGRRRPQSHAHELAQREDRHRERVRPPGSTSRSRCAMATRTSSCRAVSPTTCPSSVRSSSPPSPTGPERVPHTAA